LGDILTTAGFRKIDGSDVDVRVADVVEGGSFDNPTLVRLDGGEAFVECRAMPELREGLVEVQLGAARFWQASIFSDSHYTPNMRDQLVSVIEKATCQPDFQVGFSIHLGKDEPEWQYREWFSECVVDGVFSLARLVKHEWLSAHAIFAGPPYVQKHGRDVFLKCPAWRVTEPREDVICVFFDNVYPAGDIRRREEVSHIKEALPYLRSSLPAE